MEHKGMVVVVGLGLFLASAGCDPATNSSDEKTLGNSGYALKRGNCLKPEDDCGGDRVLELGMDLATFQRLAVVNSNRCAGGINWRECTTELDYARSKQLITLEAYTWGLANGYYPAVTRTDKIAAVCKCGCFEASSRILIESPNGTTTQWVYAKDVKEDSKLVALNELSELSQPGLTSKPIKALTHGQELPALYVFSLSNGRQLKVTQNHGMLLSDGRVVEAKTLSVGAEFVGLDGSIVRVNNISFERTEHDVFNFEVDSQDKSGHFIAAEGVLVGDLAWQNQLGRELGSIVIRR
jgi:hypothetical protein